MSVKAVRVRVRVDRKVLFNGALKDWAEKPPEVFKDAIAINAKPEPHMKAILIVMADAVLAERSVNIDVTTTPKGFTMVVGDK